MAVDPDAEALIEAQGRRFDELLAQLGARVDASDARHATTANTLGEIGHSLVDLHERVAHLEQTEPPPPPPPPPDPALFDSRRDGWQLGTLFGTGAGTYGHDSNTKHRYYPENVIEQADGSLILRTEKVGSEYRSGAISARENHGASAPLRTPVGDGFLAEVKMTYTPMHSLWHAVWGRHYPGGASTGEIDMMEAMHVDGDGFHRVRQSLHRLLGVSRTNGTNEAQAWPEILLNQPVTRTFGIRCERVGERRFAWTFLVDGGPTGLRRTGDDGVLAGWRDGPVVGDTSTADWADFQPGVSSFDWMFNVAVGGNHIGDPDIVPYNGKLQRGTDGIPANAPGVVSWDGSPVETTVHWFRVEAI